MKNSRQFNKFLEDHNALFFQLNKIEKAVIRAGEFLVNTLKSGKKYTSVEMVAVLPTVNILRLN